MAVLLSSLPSSLASHVPRRDIELSPFMLDRASPILTQWEKSTVPPIIRAEPTGPFMEALARRYARRVATV
jgi:hypothetical protein